MKIQTFSILAGTAACNARCPFCISRMTPLNGVEAGAPPLKKQRFLQACRFAKMSGVSTVMFTGKGEPTLYPQQIDEFFELLQPFHFGLVELQTNGIRIWQKKDFFREALARWQRQGLTTVAISVVSHDPETNRRIYLPKSESYIDLPGLIGFLHEADISVRLSVTMTRDTMDTIDSFLAMIDFARNNQVEQLTFRPVNAPDTSHIDQAALEWTKDKFCRPEFYEEIVRRVEADGTKLLELMHGARVYDFFGQNVCLANCLTRSDDPEQIRQIIYFPDGRLRYDWVLPGAILF